MSSQKLELKRQIFQKFIHVRVFQIKLTDDCNFDCSFCYYRHQKKKEEIKESVLEKLKKIIFDYLDKNEDEIVFLLLHGGEPLLYSKLEEFLRFFSHERIIFLMTTNGSLLDEEKLNMLLSRRVRIGISYDEEGRFKTESEKSIFLKRLSLIADYVFEKNNQFLKVLSIFKDFEEQKRLLEKLNQINERLILLSEIYVGPNFRVRNYDFFQYLDYRFQFYRSKLKNDEIFYREAIVAKMLPPLATKDFSYVPGCGSCLSNVIVLTDGSLKLCSKNYKIEPFEHIDSVSSIEEIENSILNSKFIDLKTKKFLSVCADRLNCKYLPLCIGGCLNRKLLDEKRVCSMLIQNI